MSKAPEEAFFLEDPLEVKWRQPMPLEIDFRDQYMTLELPDANLAQFLVPNINIRSGKFRVDLTEVKLVAVVELIPNIRTMFDIWLVGQKMPVRIICLTDDARSVLETELWVGEYFTLEGVTNLQEVVGPLAYRYITKAYQIKGLMFPWFYAAVSDEDKLSPTAPISEQTMNQIIKLVRKQYPNKAKRN